MPTHIDGCAPADFSELADDIAAVMFPMRQSMYRAFEVADAGKEKGV